MKYAVSYGEPFDRINFVGPFDSFDEAEVWADMEIGMHYSWWVIQLEDPIAISMGRE